MRIFLESLCVLSTRNRAARLLRPNGLHESRLYYGNYIHCKSLACGYLLHTLYCTAGASKLRLHTHTHTHTHTLSLSLSLSLSREESGHLFQLPPLALHCKKMQQLRRAFRNHELIPLGRVHGGRPLLDEVVLLLWQAFQNGLDIGDVA
ncbi:unnamed protein product [Chondrus crispus]|uniref:Uncharacterized protein n=1 Tax=Chondrus crispus TaxID=2769 RepID=R7QL53_CHOCR|nr:unnamed protein product [Chondrus crispus]CDF39252.1 unnamed protein product [Chondrus crispus]|eukprot:XP_005719163.1 unnamed protein product [Chondrus crispus]